MADTAVVNSSQPSPSFIYPPESAGRIMHTSVPTAPIDATIGDVQKLLSARTQTFGSIYYIYVLDSQKHLKGILSVKEVFRQKETTLVKTCMSTTLHTARPHSDQEHVVYLALKHRLKAIPVVDKAGKFLGVVSNRTILSTLYHETGEDILHFAGIHNPKPGETATSLSVMSSIVHRLPWLLLGLVGGLLTAQIVGRFESTLEQNLLIAAYIPLIVYMADAVGTQMEVFIIRDFAIDPTFNFIRYLFKQLLIVTLIGVASSLGLFLVSLLLHGTVSISFLLSISLLIAIVSSVVTGLVIPFIFHRLKFDPADASGPVATIIQDILSVFIYFSVASWLLK